jgi:hypothetical protein
MPILAGAQASGTTLADLIAETRRHLLSGQRPSLNKLAQPVVATDATLVLEFDAAQIQAGSLLEIGLEVFYVWSVSSKTVMVERAQDGSRAQDHPAGSVVTLNPKFPQFTIAKALNDDLADLSSPVHGLYSIRLAELQAGLSSGLDLEDSSDVLEVIDVRARHGGLPGQWWPITNYDLILSADPTDFSSGQALMLREGVRVGSTVRVLYKATFGRLTNLTDNVQDIAGLPESMHDLPPLGAAIRLVAPREIRRNFTEEQGSSRRSEEVPPGAVAGSTRGLVVERQRRIQSEAAKLAQQYPDKSFIPDQWTSWGWP